MQRIKFDSETDMEI